MWNGLREAQAERLACALFSFAEKGGRRTEIVDEAGAGLFAGLLVGSAEDGRGMDSCENWREAGRAENFAAILRDAKAATEQRLRSGCAEADDEGRVDGFHFGVKPGAAGGNFASAGLLVNAAFAARLPLEMFDGIGDVDEAAVDAGFNETAVE